MKPKSKYRYVRYLEVGRDKTANGLKMVKLRPWHAHLQYHDLGERRHFSACFSNERDAALQVDRWLISIGKEPVNILKRVNN